MKSIIKITVLSLILAITTASVNAQTKFVKTNVFHKVLPPTQLIKMGKLSLKYGANATYPDITTFRIIGPVAGYGVVKNNLVAGVGYGFNRLHYIDSLNIYHAKYSFNAMLWGSAALGVPSLNPNNKNVVGIGPSIGLFNNILIVGYCWKAPFIAGTSGQSDLIIAGHLPIN